MSKKFYITTPIYYTNGNLHIGHAYTTTLCDVMARYKKNRGYDTFFLTGTDEHGEKVQQKAKTLGLHPKEYVDGLVADVKELWVKLDIKYDKYIRTTDEYHKETVRKIFSYLLEKGDIYKSEYKGQYCVPCESFWTETEVGEEHLCPDCKRKVEQRSEEAYFFKMSKYADRLLKYYNEHPGFIEPFTRQVEMVNNFITPGLNDLCVSRTSFDWGISINEDPKHVVYVWLDALTNYITALGYKSDNHELFDKYWKNDDEHQIIHVIGKEIVRFHVIYWPIFLMALDLPLPTAIYAHGWFNMPDGKMSKSKGNIIRNEPLIERYGVDALRFYFVKRMTLGLDAVFTPEGFIDIYNTHLANDYGNLLNRTIGMITKYFDGIVPAYKGNVADFDEAFLTYGKASIDSYCLKMDQLKIDEAMTEVFNYISKANKYIEENMPWSLAKNPADRNKLESVMVHLVICLRQASIMLSPVLVNATKKAFEQLNVLIDNQKFETINDLNCMEGVKLNKAEPLFIRLDSEVEIQYILDAMK